MQMDWNKLKSFYYAAKFKNITMAARELNIFQSSLSRQIMSLEKQIGGKLFRRTSDGVLLTEQGEILYRSVQKVFSEIEQAKSNLSEDPKIPRGTLKVNCILGFSTLYLIPKINDFMTKYPNIQLQIKTTDSLPDFNTRECDILIHPILPESQLYIQKHLKRYHLNIYASKEYLEKNGTPLTAKDLDSHKLITYGSQSRYYESSNWILSVGMPKGDIRVPFIETNTTQDRFLLAQKGLGITVLPASHPGLETSNLVRLLENIESPDVDLFYIYPKDTQHMEKVKVFTDWLNETYRDK